MGEPVRSTHEYSGGRNGRRFPRFRLRGSASTTGSILARRASVPVCSGSCSTLIRGSVHTVVVGAFEIRSVVEPDPLRPLGVYV